MYDPQEAISRHSAQPQAMSSSSQVGRVPPPIPSRATKPPPRITRPSLSPILPPHHTSQQPNSQQRVTSTVEIPSIAIETMTSPTLQPAMTGNAETTPASTRFANIPPTTSNTRFNFRSRFRDWVAVVLFWIHIGGYVVISYFAFKGISSPVRNSAGLSDPLFGSNSLKMYGIVCLIGLFFSLVWIVLLILEGFYAVDLWNICLGIPWGDYYAWSVQDVRTIGDNSVLGDILYGELVVMEKQIMLYLQPDQQHCPCCSKISDDLDINCVGAAISYCFQRLVVHRGMMMGSYQFFGGLVCSSSYDETTGSTITSCTNIVLTLILLYSIFAFYWISQVVRYVIHVSVAGIFSSHYLYAPRLPLYCASQDSWNAIHDKKISTPLNQGLAGSVIMLGKRIRYKPPRAIGSTLTMILLYALANLLLGTLVGLFTFLYLTMTVPEITHQRTLITCLTLYSGIVGFSFFNLTSEWVQAGNIATFVAITEDLDLFSSLNPALIEMIEKEGGLG
ncbi:hypothetical protein K493DRAFT_301739 [Basidiobolus meristosporus CBS 931.73]|uniref:Uncharacterized protein n=1 Tax=Basidiobolus meristosporus CBS 931.73 TaxID=1314790 RepID=A0A1Y1YAF1_9FUNG|nr:hypothetical protein K493DRAFT_301739 [Basidiobolus meristosporus CBS 931.73]|eukprot:ORX94990.1 hypothetical protein K493DRAFT_301739 [Basidiobolus meristosporus CBS 931.73]